MTLRWRLALLLACIVASAPSIVASAPGGVASAPGGLAAEDLEATLEEAVAGYAEALDTEDRDVRIERFRRVERLFSTVASSGDATADLYANLGNAALQSEHLGNAVLAYRRALLLDPDHARATQSLEHVRSLAPEWVPRPEGSALFDSFFEWHRTVSSVERSWAAALAFAIAALLFAAGVMFHSVAARNAGVLPALVWLGLVVSMTFDPAAAAGDQAVVVGREVVARSADSVRAPARFARPLPIGTEVEIRESRETWLRIALANGREGWVRASSVVRVLP